MKYIYTYIYYMILFIIENKQSPLSTSKNPLVSLYINHHVKFIVKGAIYGGELAACIGGK